MTSKNSESGLSLAKANGESLRRSLGATEESSSSPNSVIRAVVAFANGDISPKWEDQNSIQILSDELQATIDARGIDLQQFQDARKCGKPLPPETGSSFDESATRKPIAVRNIENGRGLAIRMLSAAADGTNALNAFYAQLIETVRDFQPVVGYPVRGKVDGRYQLQWRLASPEDTPRPWVEFAALCLLTDANGDSTNIGRCNWEPCSRFFVIKRGVVGKPQTKFCCDKHRENQHNTTAAERQRASRTKRAASIAAAAAAAKRARARRRK